MSRNYSYFCLALFAFLVGGCGSKPHWDNQLVFLVEKGFKGSVSVEEAQGSVDPKVEPGVYVLRVSDKGIAKVPKLESLPSVYKMKAVVVPSPMDHAYSSEASNVEASVTGGSSEVTLIGGVTSRRRIYDIQP